MALRRPTTASSAHHQLRKGCSWSEIDCEEQPHGHVPKVRPAQLFSGRHRPQYRGSGRCFRASCGRGAIGPPAGSASSCGSASFWFSASNGCRRQSYPTDALDPAMDDPGVLPREQARRLPKSARKQVIAAAGGRCGVGRPVFHGSRRLRSRTSAGTINRAPRPGNDGNRVRGARGRDGVITPGEFIAMTITGFSPQSRRRR